MRLNFFERFYIRWGLFFTTLVLLTIVPMGASWWIGVPPFALIIWASWLHYIAPQTAVRALRINLHREFRARSQNGRNS